MDGYSFHKVQAVQSVLVSLHYRVHPMGVSALLSVDMVEIIKTREKHC